MAEKKYIIDNAELMAEWNWEKNNKLGLDPTKLTCGANKKAWWTCYKCGYEWETKINFKSNIEKILLPIRRKISWERSSE